MHNTNLFLLFPLVSSISYTLSAILFKRAMEQGVSAWYINFLSNIASFVLVIPIFFIVDKSPFHFSILPPLLASVIFMVGQLASLLALQKGDVSVATPLLGTKVLFVALFTIIVIHQPISLMLWTAAGCTAGGFFLLCGPKTQSRRKFTATVAFSLVCAASFAFCDILIQKWAPSYGAGQFLIWLFLLNALVSFFFIPAFKTSWRTYPGTVWRPLLFGVLFVAIQAVLMGIALSWFGNATATNIVFSLRGIWSVIMIIIWKFGAFFNNAEKNAGTSMMISRLAGSGLLFVAIVLILL
jgi:drug/metabolite transporter (DMT)-like permease